MTDDRGEAWLSPLYWCTIEPLLGSLLTLSASPIGTRCQDTEVITPYTRLCAVGIRGRNTALCGIQREKRDEALNYEKIKIIVELRTSTLAVELTNYPTIYQREIELNQHYKVSSRRQERELKFPDSQEVGAPEWKKTGQKEGGKWLSISRKRNRKNSDISSLHVDADSTYVGKCSGATEGKALPGWEFTEKRREEEERKKSPPGGSDKTSTMEARRPGCF
ncbi:hypothetical protein ALC62_05830 [Cyphomyrmex costatus]|uniref:Uncharacterized protein n=1 Tax=Cyphomyrmex costatus TaxID=456900 RepID=A0A151IJE6_9HYME|nr:hypothetical protein ALC62_05830 [Cyphomyrmex costatus]